MFIQKYMNKINNCKSKGLFTQVSTTPIWLIKTRMCVQNPNDPEAYKGIIGNFFFYGNFHMK